MKKHYFLSKNYCGSFLGIFVNFGLLFIPISGHTGRSDKVVVFDGVDLIESMPSEVKFKLN